MLTLSQVIETLTGVHPQGVDREIHGATIDSRKVTPGSLFIALPGESVDGHDYVHDAFNQGANFALINQDFSTKFEQYEALSAWFH